MNSTKNKLLVAIGILALASFAVSPLRAQAPPDQPPPQGQATQGQDPQNQSNTSDPGVARVSFIRGEVDMLRGDSGDSSAATLNLPLVAGDQVSTGGGSRAELQLDFADVIRLDEHADVTLATLLQNRIQVQLSQGLATFSVLRGSEADVEIDTPNVSVHPTREGRYRVQVDPSGDTFIVVREGQAQVSTPQGSTTVNKGELITVHGTGDDTAYQTSRASGNDSWDDWNRDRDNIIQNADGVRRTNPYYTGAGDLDPYGSWSDVPDYGPVWIPRVDVGWAPYRAGRWVWEPFYGWTWVSSEAWGWAPYHYGRWFLYSGSWAWWPGPVGRPYRPLWAPAYVSFFGFGAGVGVNVGFGFGGGFGSIGWLPIGPCDYFHPWYGGYRGGYAVVGVGSVYGLRGGFTPLHAGDRFSNLRDVSFNDRLRAGVSTVGADRFGRGAVQAREVSGEEFRGGRALTGNVPVVPSRDSLRASDNPARSGAFSARAAGSQRFFTRNAPAARPQSFNEQAAGVRQSLARSAGTFNSNGGNAGGGRSFAPNGAAPGNSAATRSQGSYRPPSTSYREPLNLNRPIVNDRSYSAPAASGNRTENNGGSRSGPAPSYRSTSPAPSYRTTPTPSYNPGTSRSSPAPGYRGGGTSGGGSRGSSGHSSSGGGGRRH